MNQVVQLACARGSEGTLRVALGGEWKLARGVPAPRLVIQEIERSPLPRRVIFETGVLAGWDSGLLTFLVAVLSRCTRLGVEVDRLGLPEGVRRLLALATAVPARSGRRSPKVEPVLARVGDAAIRRWMGVCDMLAFIGDAFLSLLRCLAGKARFRRSDFLLAIQDCGARSLPIVALINLLVGLDPLHQEIPTIPSLHDQIVQTLQKLPEKIMNVTDGIERLVNSPAAQESLRDLDGLIQELAGGVKPLMASLTATSDGARRTFAQAEKTLSMKEGPAAEMAASFTETMKKAGASLDQMRSTLESYQQVAVQNANVGYDLTRTLAQLDAAARSVRSLAGYLELHPEAVLKGKR